jgi:hypothetical protein
MFLSLILVNVNDFVQMIKTYLHVSQMKKIIIIMYYCYVENNIVITPIMSQTYHIIVTKD